MRPHRATAYNSRLLMSWTLGSQRALCVLNSRRAKSRCVLGPMEMLENSPSSKPCSQTPSELALAPDTWHPQLPCPTLCLSSTRGLRQPRGSELLLFVLGSSPLGSLPFLSYELFLYSWDIFLLLIKCWGKKYSLPLSVPF